MKKTIMLFIVLFCLPLVSAQQFNSSINISLFTDFVQNNGVQLYSNNAQFSVFVPETNQIHLGKTTADMLILLNLTNTTGGLSPFKTNDYGPIASGGNTLDGVKGLNVINYSGRILLSYCSSVDDTIGVFDVTNVGLGDGIDFVSSVRNLTLPESVESCSRFMLREINGNLYGVSHSQVDDNIVVYNWTNLTNPTFLTNYNSSVNPCSVDGVQDIYWDVNRSIIISSSLTDDTVSFFNISTLTTLTCINQSTDSASPYSLDRISRLAVDEVSGVVYSLSDLDFEITGISYTDAPVITPIYSYKNSSVTEGCGIGSPTVQSNSAYYPLEFYNDNVYFANYGNQSENYPFSLCILNKSLTPITRYVNFNGNAPRSIAPKDSYIYVTSTGTVYTLNGTLLPEEAPPVDTCTYSGSGDWVITDTCTINSNVNLLNNNLHCNIGCNLFLNANISNYNKAYIHTIANAKVVLSQTGSFR